MALQFKSPGIGVSDLPIFVKHGLDHGHQRYLSREKKSYRGRWLESDRWLRTIFEQTQRIGALLDENDSRQNDLEFMGIVSIFVFFVYCIFCFYNLEQKEQHQLITNALSAT